MVAPASHTSHGAAPTETRYRPTASSVPTVPGARGDNPLPTILAKKFYEPTPVINLTGHITESLITIVSGNLWNSLSDADKAIFDAVFQEAATRSNEEIFASEAELEPAKTEILELLARQLPMRNGRFLQMEDEIASLCACIGASLTGCKVMTATSGPGFSLMQEALGYAIMTEIPCVIVNVQRGGPSTGLPTHGLQGDVNQARWGTHGDHAIVTITASNHQDVFEMTVNAFNLAESYRTPVILLLDEVVGHMREKLIIPEKEEIPLVERLRTAVKEGVDYHPYLPREDGTFQRETFLQDFDDGIREDTTIEGLGNLRPAFAAGGRDRSSRGIIPVDLFGLPADYDPIRAITKV